MPFCDQHGASEVGEQQGLAGLDGVAQGLADGLGGGADDLAAGVGGAQAGPLQVASAHDVAGQHPAAGDGELHHLLHAAGQAELGGGRAVGGDGQQRGEAAGAGVVLQLRDVEGRRGVEREHGRGEARHLQVGVAGRAAAGEGGAEGGEHVVTAEAAAGAVEHGAVAGAGGAPVHAELAGDGGELRRLHRDAGAGGGRGADGAVGAGGVEQVGQAHDAGRTGW